MTIDKITVKLKETPTSHNVNKNTIWLYQSFVDKMKTTDVVLTKKKQHSTLTLGPFWESGCPTLTPIQWYEMACYLNMRCEILSKKQKIEN